MHPCWQKAGIEGQEVEVSDQAERNSDLVEVIKRNGDFRKNYGPLLGAWLFDRALNAATGRRPLWWKSALAVATLAGWLALKYGLPTLG